MKDETTITNIADSIYVRIPAGMARYFKIKENNLDKCKIEDIDNKTARLTFE